VSELEGARASRDAVLLIWSPNARSQSYMLEWAKSIEPARLVEIAHETGDWPAIKRIAPVIEFVGWRGQRGARCWKALNERLGAVTRALGPPEFPAKALMAAGFAGMAVVTGAVGARLATPIPAPPGPTTFEEVAAVDPQDGMGGALSAIEPASLEDLELRVRRFRDVELIPPLPPEQLASLPDYEEHQLRNRTLLERLNAYNPLNWDDDA
jgi:hypothetical protein